MIRAVDCAYPQTSYPSWATVVCGYAGGHTAHQWTPAEVDAVRSSGRTWLAIWTARNKAGQPPLTAGDGNTDGAGMVKQLLVYGYDKTLPVFYDVEPGIYDLDPNGAKAAIGAWKAWMQRAGYTKTYVYTIARQDGDWIADWTNVAPTSLPAGKVGVQYGSGSSFDYNVFADTLLGDDVLDPADPIVVELRAAAKALRRVNDGGDFNIPAGQASVGGTLSAILPGQQGLFTQENANTAAVKAVILADLQNAETDIENAVKGIVAAGGDPEVVAAAVVGLISKKLGAA